MNWSFSLLVFVFLFLRLDFGADGLEGSFGLFEGLGHTSLDGVECLSAGSLCLLGGLAVLLEVSNAGLVALFDGLLLVGTADLIEGVKSVHQDSVGQRVLLGGVVKSGGLDSAELGLDLIGVDDSGEVSAGHHISVEGISTLFDVSASVVAEDTVESLEGIAGPDDKAAEVTTGGELEEVKSVNIDEVNAWEVSGSALHALVLLTVNDQRATSEDVSGVSHLTLASSDLLGISASLDVLRGAEVLEGGKEGLGAVNIEAVDNEGKLGGVHDSVAASENQRSDGGGSNS